MFRNFSISIAIITLTSQITGFASAQMEPDGLEFLEDRRVWVVEGSNQHTEIIDGDTLWLGNLQLRLYGIDAPEPGQECSIEGKPKSYCHMSATEALRSLASSPNFRCDVKVKGKADRPWVRHNRYVANCYVGTLDVNAEIVRQGWAYADDLWGTKYDVEQREAQARNAGMHASEHIKPSDWRRRERSSESSCSCP